MDVNFKSNEPAPKEPIIFEQVFAEKPSGGLVANQTYDVPAGTAMGQSGTKFVPIKGFMLYEDAASNATALKIKKGSGVAVGDVVATGKVGVAVTAVDASNADFDIITISALGVAVVAGQVLYQAAEVSADDANPIYTPLYLLGHKTFANEGDQSRRLINGANIRKETAPVADEVVALMSGIHKV